MSSDEGTGLGDTLEETDSHDVLGSFGGGCNHCESSPNNHHAGEENAGFEMVEGEIARDLANDISSDSQKNLKIQYGVDQHTQR